MSDDAITTFRRDQEEGYLSEIHNLFEMCKRCESEGTQYGQISDAHLKRAELANAKAEELSRLARQELNNAREAQVKARLKVGEANSFFDQLKEVDRRYEEWRASFC